MEDERKRINELRGAEYKRVPVTRRVLADLDTPLSVYAKLARGRHSFLLESVEGGETRIPLSADGHFWVRADVNGVPGNFMIDTGATLTAISAGLAERAGREPRRGGIPIMLGTANGTVQAHVATVDSLTFGNVSASGTDAAIAENFGDFNVIGMNVLARLGSWRVEDHTLILVPRADATIS